MLQLRYYGTSNIPVEAEGITPDQLAGKSAAEIATVPVQHGNAQVPLGEFFHVTGSADDGDIRIDGDCSRVKWIGAGMTRGRIVIDGAAGMHLGSEMRGGEIHVYGPAGDWVGAEMRGGRIHVHGHAGHLVGGAYRGSPKGMRGGVILVDGQAGNEIGSGMRRGLIAIGGPSGDFVGISLIAGSIFLFGPTGLRTGAGMKRGTIAAFSERPKLLPTFRYDCTYQPVFMRIYLRQLRQWGFPPAQLESRQTFERWSGDLVALGKGEVLYCVGP
ncbi:MAG: formylmethanofuran dehydrogenase subunit C [Gemmataceae bacterium]|nr:formylmethanofuran dehydrogenase subunit C [Gemmataceae bacterium]MDW8265021.1 formylmethanofuran dehydrogenase subunit C [Gemmataceae bacterium]